MTVRPPSRESSIFSPALIGSVIGVVLSVPIAAYGAAALGDTYDTRVLIYGLSLLWCIFGAVAVYLRTRNAETGKLTPGRILLWCVSLWLWPLLLAASLFGKKRRSE